MRQLLPVLMLVTAAAFSGDAPALDAAKYPQDTPQNAIQSIIKALEAKDFTYWIGNLILPEDSKRIAEKHGGLDKAAVANSDPKYSERIAKQIEAMRGLSKDGKVSELEKDGKKIVRFVGTGQVIQFEQQADKRWCMNIRVTSEKNMDNPGAPKAPAKEAEPAK